MCSATLTSDKQGPGVVMRNPSAPYNVWKAGEQCDLPAGFHINNELPTYSACIRSHSSFWAQVVRELLGDDRSVDSLRRNPEFVLRRRRVCHGKLHGSRLFGRWKADVEAEVSIGERREISHWSASRRAPTGIYINVLSDSVR